MQKLKRAVTDAIEQLTNLDRIVDGPSSIDFDTFSRLAAKWKLALSGQPEFRDIADRSFSRNE